MAISGYNLQGVFYTNKEIRPVVCLKSSIPATVGTGDYDFCLTK
jgi:hypothetical protein